MLVFYLKSRFTYTKIKGEFWRRRRKGNWVALCSCFTISRTFWTCSSFLQRPLQLTFWGTISSPKMKWKTHSCVTCYSQNHVIFFSTVFFIWREIIVFLKKNIPHLFPFSVKMILKEMWKSKNHFEPGTKKKRIVYWQLLQKKKSCHIRYTKVTMFAQNHDFIP